MTPTPDATETPNPAVGAVAATVHFKATSGEGFLLYGLLVIALLIVLLPIVLKGRDRNFFRIPYITWFLLHYSIAALAIMAITLLGVTGIIGADVISALLGSLLGYILGSTARNAGSGGGGSNGGGDDDAAATKQVVIAEGVVPPATAGAAYSYKLEASGGTAPYTWALVAAMGALPPGLVLDPATGTISGVPTAAGRSSFAVTATDAAGQTGQRMVTLDINGPQSGPGPRSRQGSGDFPQRHGGN